MISRLRHILSSSNVLSTLALFLALAGGSAYAAHEAIDSSDVVDGSLTGFDVQDQSIKNTDVGLEAIGTTRIKNANVGTTDTAKLPGVRVRQTTAQAIASPGQFPIDFDEEVFDTDGMADLTADNSEVTVNTAGIYSITGKIGWAADADGFRDAIITVDGLPENIEREQALSSGDSMMLTTTVMRDLDAGDTVGLSAAHGNTPTLDTQALGSNTSAVLSVQWVAPSP